MAEKQRDIIFTLEFETPVTAHGEQVTKLEFAKPTVKDIAECGLPVKFNPFVGAEIEFDSANMVKMLARLAVVPPGTIQTLEPQDFMTAAWGVAGFFLPRPSSATSS